MPTIKRQSRSRQRSAGATARPLSAEACRNPSDKRAFAENRRSDAHNRRTLRDGERHVVRHAHRQFRAVLGAGRARGENRVARAAQMRKAGANRGLVIDVRADGHQAFEPDAVQLRDLCGDVDGSLRVATREARRP